MLATRSVERTVADDFVFDRFNRRKETATPLSSKPTTTSGCFFFSSRRRHTRFDCDWSSDVCSSDLSLSLIAVRQNEVMKKLAAWAAILAVPTLIAGVYGMNFESMPELHWRWGYEAARSEERRVGKECRSRWSPYH